VFLGEAGSATHYMTAMLEGVELVSRENTNGRMQLELDSRMFYKADGVP
jgi:hypothetical protein